MKNPTTIELVEMLRLGRIVIEVWVERNDTNIVHFLEKIEIG